MELNIFKELFIIIMMCEDLEITKRKQRYLNKLLKLKKCLTDRNVEEETAELLISLATKSEIKKATIDGFSLEKQNNKYILTEQNGDVITFKSHSNKYIIDK